ncbi:LysR family transcriptional regulator [Pandoraea sp. NE5]|uniref:LysR substrate-binding domain-containing protein n=1 Tax=Pandoraea sp. NE5 TaxID=2904129 RepID=UPI0021C453D6|nr:LysR substrate-binding domain-containing protein [Pandoraea sp. NE5]BDD91981.1 LysR family transcriptional regulator [Pandoraea sp. NE5]
MTSTDENALPRDDFDWAALSRLKLRHLLLYRNLCDTAAISRAAELSHMTQPGATKLVQEMEEMFKARLFERGKMGTEPTAYGQALLRYVRLVLADLAEAKAHVESLTRGESGMVRLGHIPSVPAEICAQACTALRDVYPNVCISVVEARSDALIDALRRGELDMALARVTSDADIDGLSAKAIYNEPFSAVVQAGANVPPKRPMPWVELARQQWVLPPRGSLSRLAVDLAFVRNKLTGPRAAVECQTLEQSRYYVITGGLFGVLPATDALRLQEQNVIEVVRSNLAPPLAPVSLLLRQGRESAPSIEKLASLVEESASRHTKQGVR